MRPSKKHARSSTSRTHRSRRTSDTLKMTFIEEPLLEFGYAQKLVYPRDGLYLFGPPNSAKDVTQIRYGVIGTSEGVRRLRSWASKINRYIPIPPRGPLSRKIEPQHVPFPGFSEAFRCHWPPDAVFTIDDIEIREIESTLRLANRYEAIHKTVDLYVSRLIRENNRLENPPAFWFVVIPEIVYQLGRPNSVVPKSEQIAGQIQISENRARNPNFTQ